MKTEHTTGTDEAVASFKDDPMELVRCLAGVAAQRARMTLEQRAAEPDPLDDWSPMVLAARRICLLRGYNDDGNERPGFMERQARAELEAKAAPDNFQTIYNHFLSEAKAAGFLSIGDAIRAAAKANNKEKS